MSAEFRGGHLSNALSTTSTPDLRIMMLMVVMIRDIQDLLKTGPVKVICDMIKIPGRSDCGDDATLMLHGLGSELSTKQSDSNAVRNARKVGFKCWLSGPLRLRLQSWSRTRLRIAVSIAFLFRACFKGVLGAIVPLSRG